MRIEAPRPGVFSVVLTSHELSVLVAGARMSLSLIEEMPEPAGERPRAALEKVLGDLDAGLARLRADSTPEGS